MICRMPRSVAVNIAVLGWWPAGVIFATASLYIVKDEIAMQANGLLVHLGHAIFECTPCMAVKK